MAETVVKNVKSDALKAALVGVKQRLDKLSESLSAVATETSAGRVKPGVGLSVAADGTLNVTGEAQVDAAALPAASAQNKGAVKIGSGIDVDSDGVISVAHPTNISAFVNDKQYQTAAEVASAADSAAKAAVGELTKDAPEAFDTLKEIGDYIEQHEDAYDALQAAVGVKADKSVVSQLSNDVALKANSSDVYSKTVADSIFVKSADLQYMSESEASDLVTEVFGA